MYMNQTYCVRFVSVNVKCKRRVSDILADKCEYLCLFEAFFLSLKSKVCTEQIGSRRNAIKLNQKLNLNSNLP